MHHLNKNPDAHRRLARGVQRFSRSYMKQAEFRCRQMWLDFKDSAGTALQAIADTVDNSRAAFDKWLRKFKRPAEKITEKNPQRSFPFMFWFFNSKPTAPHKPRSEAESA